jgi:hypothetical protein
LEYILSAMTVPEARSDNCHAVISVTSYYQYQRVFEIIQSTVDRMHQEELKSGCVKEHGTLDVALDAGPMFCIGRDRKLGSRLIQLRVRRPGITVGEMMRTTWEIFEKHDKNIDCELMRCTTVPLLIYGSTYFDHPYLTDIDSAWLCEHPVEDWTTTLARSA